MEFQLPFDLRLYKLHRFMCRERFHKLRYSSVAVDVDYLKAGEILIGGLWKERPNVQGAGLTRQAKYRFTLRFTYTHAQLQVQLLPAPGLSHVVGHRNFGK
jgi:hypothetical protein